MHPALCRTQDECRTSRGMYVRRMSTPCSQVRSAANLNGAEHVRPLRGRVASSGLLHRAEPARPLRVMLRFLGCCVGPTKVGPYESCDRFFVGADHDPPGVAPGITRYVRLSGGCRNEYVARDLRATHPYYKNESFDLLEDYIRQGRLPRVDLSLHLLILSQP